MNAALVLLVEDDHTLRQSMAQWLELNDFRVTQASNAKEALKLLSVKSGCGSFGCAMRGHVRPRIARWR